LANVGMITANLIANTTRFSRPMVQAQNQLQEFNKRAETVSKRLEAVSRAGRAAGLALGALTAAIGLSARSAARYGDEIDKMAIRTGIGREELQEMRHVAELTGVNFDSLTRATTRLGQQLVDNEGKTNETTQLLERLGLELRDTGGEIRDMNDLFDDAIEGLSRMDSEVERNTAAYRLFGRQGTELLPIIAAGGEEIERMSREARELGLVMGDAAIRDLAVFNDEMGTVQRRVQAAGRDMLMQFLPAIRVVLDWVNRGVDWFNNLSTEQRQNIVQWVALTAAILATVVAFGLFAKAMTMGIAVIKTIAGIFAFIKGVVLGFGAILAGVSLLAVLKFALIGVALGLLYMAWRNNWFGIRDTLMDVWESIQPIIDAVIEFGRETINTVWNWAVEAFGVFWDFLHDTLWPFLTDAAATAWDWTVNAAGVFWEWVRDTLWPFLAEGASTIWNWTLNALGAFWDWVTDTLWPFLTAAAETAWDWTLNAAGAFWDWVTDTLWPFLTAAASTAWDWTLNALGAFWTWLRDTLMPFLTAAARTAWDWTINALGAFWTFLRDTLMPFLTAAASTAWDWTVTAAGAFWEWLKDTLWPFLTEAASTAWSWTVNAAGAFWDWLSDTLWPFLTEGASTTWEWTINALGTFWEFLKDDLWPFLTDSAETAWAWTINALGTFWEFLRDTLWPFLDDSVTTTWNWTLKAFGAFWDWIEKGIGFIGETVQTTIEFGERGLRGITDGIAAVQDFVAGRDRAAVDIMADPAQAAIDFAALGIEAELRAMPDRGFFERLFQGQGIFGFQHGGILAGAGGPDSIPAMLAPGEAIIPAAIWRQGIGAVADWFRALGVPGFQAGGVAGGNAGGGGQGVLGAIAPGLADMIAEQGGVISAVGDFVGDIPQMIITGMMGIFDQLINAIGFIAETALGEEEAERVTGQLRGFQDEIRKVLGALGFFEEELDEAAQAAREEAERRAEAERLAAIETRGTAEAMAFLRESIQQSMPILNRAVELFRQSTADEMDAMGNVIKFGMDPLMALGVVIADLVMQSETFQQIMAIVNPVLQALADALGLLLEPLLPVIQILSDILLPLLEVFGQILSTLLLPVMRILFEALRFFGIIILFLAEVFQRVRAAILGAVGALVLGLGNALNNIWRIVGRDLVDNLRNVGQSMVDSAGVIRDSADDLAKDRQNLTDLTWDEAMARAKNTEALEESTRVMVGVPAIFRIALRRAQAVAEAVDPAGQAQQRQLPIEAMAEGGIVRRPTLAMIGERGPEAVTPLDDLPTGEPIQITINLNGPVFGMRDFQRAIEQAVGQAARSAGLAEHGMVVKFT